MMAKAPKEKREKLPRRYRQVKPMPLFFRVLGRIFSFLFGILATLLAIVIITCCIVGVSLTTYVMSFVDMNVDFEGKLNLYALDLNYTTIMYATDPDTDTQYELKRLQGEGNRIWVDLEDIPDYAIDALISVEDERFYTHNGVDWKRTLGAFLNEYVFDIYGNTQGGSTITQQLIKNLTQEDDVRIERKLQEIFTAVELEKRYSKDDILEAYFNRVHFGNNTYGIEAAANLYFGKHTSELTLAEAASIVGITQYPAYYNPFTHPAENKERQETVLYKMFELGKIDRLEYDMALVETLQFVGSSSSAWTSSLTWFEDAVYWELMDDLVNQKGYSYAHAYDVIYNGGLRIETTLNQSVQDALDHVFISGEIFPEQATGGEPDEVQPQAAALVMDYTGAIVGLSGGIGEKTEDLLFSRATKALRQNGSTMKPLGAYGPAIEYNLINYSTVLEDAPIDLKQDGKVVKWPVNYYGEYRGNMTCADALSMSVNTVAVRVGQMVTPERSFEFVRDKLHVSSMVESRQGSSDIGLGPMNLGSTTDGISLKDLVGAYQIFGDGGLYNEPHTYTRVYDHDGTLLIENAYAPSRALTEESAMVMNKMLQYVMYGPNGTGASATFTGQKLFGKTGTTSDDKDHWFVGGSPYYVAAVWWGYDIPEELHYYGYHPPMRAWRTFMTEIHQGLETIDFPVSDKVVQREYCNESGLLFGPDCPAEDLRSGWYKVDNVPPECDHNSLTPEEGEEKEESSEGSPGFTDDESSSVDGESGGSLTSEVPDYSADSVPSGSESVPSESDGAQSESDGTPGEPESTPSGSDSSASESSIDEGAYPID